MIRAVALYMLISLLVVGAAGWVLLLVYPGPAGQQAVLASAAIALVVQLVAFLLLRLSVGRNVFAGWGVGALLRFLAIGVMATVVADAMGLDRNAALVSLAAFLFLSMLVEPLLVTV
ncbi:MAG: hypothetical protein MUF21_00445 [Gemmatimonadaceae bacterium]|jgi:hypothetical protein|nr:hypothetical protein [Gemmatimonadaceae bacterium]